MCIRVSPRTFALIACLALVFLACEEAPGASPDADACREILDRQGRVRVFVDLSRTSETSPASHRHSSAANTRSVRRRILGELANGSCELRWQYRHSPVLLLDLTHVSALHRLETLPEVARVYPDRGGRASLRESRELVRAMEAQALGGTGRGTVVAVLDSGIDSDHPDFEGAILHQQTVLGAVSSDGAEDDNGHGTHIAGVLASRGVVAQPGMAPDAKLVVIKVVSSDLTGFISDWAIGLEQVLDLHDADNGIEIDVINLSLASVETFGGPCPDAFTAFHEAVLAAASRNIILVAASGNAGEPERMSAPACYESVISVASVSDHAPEELASSTNTGPFLDLLAPGEEITSSGLAGGLLTTSGSSQACAHVAGLACVLREIDEDLPADTVLGVLQSTGVAIEDPRSGRVYPRLDALDAVDMIIDAVDCDRNGRIDLHDLSLGVYPDCNANGIYDGCDILSGISPDSDGDGVSDECGQPFIRGDSNLDAEIDLSDPVFTLAALFLGTQRLECREAADSDGDGVVGLSDGIYLLGFLFLNTAPPPPPGGKCGFPTPIPEPVDCESYPPCEG